MLLRNVQPVLFLFILFVSCNKYSSDSHSQNCHESEIYYEIENIQRDFYEKRITQGVIALFNSDSMKKDIDRHNKYLSEMAMDSSITNQQFEKVRRVMDSAVSRSKYQDPLTENMIRMILQRIISTSNLLGFDQDTTLPKFAILYNEDLNAGTAKICNEDVLFINQSIFEVPSFACKLLLRYLPKHLLNEISNGRIVNENHLSNYIITKNNREDLMIGLKTTFSGFPIPDLLDFPPSYEEFFVTLFLSQVTFAIAHEYVHKVRRDNFQQHERKHEFLENREDTLFAKKEVVSSWRSEYFADSVASTILLNFDFPNYQPDRLEFALGGILFFISKRAYNYFKDVNEGTPVQENMNSWSEDDSTYVELFNAMLNPNGTPNYDNINNEWLLAQHPPLAVREYCISVILKQRISYLSMNGAITPQELAYYEFGASLKFLLGALYRSIINDFKPTKPTAK